VSRRLLALALVAGAVLLAAACGDDDGVDDAAGDPSADTTTAPAPPTTAVPDFEGDPDSAFCQRSREAAERPVLDPFEAGLDPREVELRFRALAQRFEGFAELAPEPLADDLALLDRRFDELAGILAGAGYDFERLATSGQDLSLLDDPALADVATRLAAYQAQVCAR
jgi:hypothetical protein